MQLFVWTLIIIIINVTMPHGAALSEYSPFLPCYPVHVPHVVYRTCNASPAVCAGGDEKGTLARYISESAAACLILKTNILFQPRILDRSPLRCFDLCFARVLRQGNETEETAEWTGGSHSPPPVSCVCEAKFNATFLS